MVQKNIKNTSVDLLVVGSGLSGMSAALFAADQGLSVAQVSQSPTLLYHSGLIDVMSTVPSAEPTAFDNPILGIEQLLKQYPTHFYAKVGMDELQQSLEQICAILEEQGVSYVGDLNQNRKVLTSVGTLKRSCLLPITMEKGADAVEQREETLIVGFKGLRGFSSRQITEMLKPDWPGLSFTDLVFPGSEAGSEVVPEHLARSLDNLDNLLPLIDLLKPLVKEVKFLGLPAILGIQKSKEIHRLMQEELGVSVFEIPMMPPSIPGMRLTEAFEAAMRQRGVILIKNQPLDNLKREEDTCFSTVIETPHGVQTITAKGLVLATGRFLGKGLMMTDEGIEESLLNLPVVQPETRSGYYRRDFFDPAGHALNRAGIATDALCRPIKLDSRPLVENLFAIGSIQSGQDWTREKSGSGIAISSAFKAVSAFREYLSGKKDTGDRSQLKSWG